jgi:hypothetical protein
LSFSDPFSGGPILDPAGHKIVSNGGLPRLQRIYRPNAPDAPRVPSELELNAAVYGPRASACSDPLGVRGLAEQRDPR